MKKVDRKLLNNFLIILFICVGTGWEKNQYGSRFENQKVFTFDDNIIVCAKIPNKKASTTLGVC